MTRKRLVQYHLKTGNISNLKNEELKAILRAADDLIATGGRSMLSKILKGSKDKKVLEHGLDKSPVYGYYSYLSLSEILQRIDWTIKNDYLKIGYSGKLPVIVYSEKGWEMEKNSYTEELLQKMTKLLGTNDYSFVNELKDRNRGMILLLIDKIKNTKNTEFIPLLKAWQKMEYKKVQAAIQVAIDYIKTT